jgi:succinate-semialdehyde dehydrogenase/glutarate-semialdehyde dehydrogenase
METTNLTDTTPKNPVVHEEFFGPVALFFRVKNEAEAVDFSNNTPFGLGGSVVAKDIEKGKRVAKQIDTGTVFTNYATWTQANLPSGGTKG